MENLIRRLELCHTCVLKSFFKPFSSIFFFIFSSIGCNNKSDFMENCYFFSLFLVPWDDYARLTQTEISVVFSLLLFFFFFALVIKAFLSRHKTKCLCFTKIIWLCVWEAQTVDEYRDREKLQSVSRPQDMFCSDDELSALVSIFSSPPKVTLLCDDCTCWLNCIILLLLFSYHYNWFA